MTDMHQPHGRQSRPPKAGWAFAIRPLSDMVRATTINNDVRQRDKRKPSLALVLADLLEQRIREGEYPPGERPPLLISWRISSEHPAASQRVRTVFCRIATWLPRFVEAGSL